ncbi:MAG: selenocysteine-specific translation elongation factor [Anaerolineales bacterium]
MRVIGTAGHVDHGKSTLVQALTGIHPDRLKEEREREMTIDLGFAWFTLPNGEEIGIVDVPGHRDFIENMLAGIGGIDAVLFIIAADEGIMPQTREHLAILNLLQIPAGVIALTKTDLAPDPHWLDLIEEDVRQTLRGTILDSAPIVRVSARKNTGVSELVQAIQGCLSQRLPRPNLNRPRLPIDRVFTMSGFGAVVTGTLSEGALTLGEEVEILPTGLRGRVRGLQSHKRKVQVAQPGSRVAVNIAGIDYTQIERGNVLAQPGQYQTTRRVDVTFHLLPEASQPLLHNTHVKFFLGATETIARVRLLGSEELQPGSEAYLQLELQNPIVALRADRYILRRPSPGETIGGGSILDPHPAARHKRFDTAILERLDTLHQGDSSQLVLQTLHLLGSATLRDLTARAAIPEDLLQTALASLLEQGRVIPLETGLPNAEGLLITAEDWHTQRTALMDELQHWHQTNPLRRGIPREELKSRVKLPARWFNLLLRDLIAAGEVRDLNPLLARNDHQIQFTARQQEQVDRLHRRFEATPFSPPTLKECHAEIGEDLCQALLDMGAWVQVSPEIIFRVQDYQKMRRIIEQFLIQHTTATVAELRDALQTTRKYILPLLEHLDAIGFTARAGDYRRLNTKS